MQQEWREEVVHAIDQALAETSRLPSASRRCRKAPQRRATPAPALRAEQGAVEEGVQRLLEQVRKAAGKNALVPPRSAPRSEARSARCSGPAKRSRPPRPTCVKARSRPAAPWMR